MSCVLLTCVPPARSSFRIPGRDTPEAVTAILDKLSPIKLVVSDRELVRRAVEARAAYGIHFYDGMIVAAAERAGCARILSEDFSDGQVYFGVTVANPFR